MSETVVTIPNAVITIDAAEVGAFNLKFGKDQSEIEAHTTKADHYEGGRVSYPVSFSLLKDVTAADYALNTDKTVSFKFLDTAGNDTTYAGTLKLFKADIVADVDGFLQVDYSGRFTSDYGETQTP